MTQVRPDLIAAQIEHDAGAGWLQPLLVFLQEGRRLRTGQHPLQGANDVRVGDHDIESLQCTAYRHDAHYPTVLRLDACDGRSEPDVDAELLTEQGECMRDAAGAAHRVPASQADLHPGDEAEDSRGDERRGADVLHEVLEQLGHPRVFEMPADGL